MDAFPTYSDLVVLVANIAFILCYATAISIQIMKSLKKKERFSIANVVVSLFAGLCGSTLTFLAMFFVFGKA